jgi:Putative auto-transporter adhesin, head GIN domain
MKRFPLLLLSLLTVFVLAGTACRVRVMRGEGNQGTTSMNPGAIKRLEVSVPSKVRINIQPEAAPLVSVTAYENILSHIKPIVDGGTLRIASDVENGWILEDREDIQIVLTVPSLEDLSLSGTSVAGIHGNLTGPKFAMELSGACQVTIDSITVNSFTTEASGASKIEVLGGAVQASSYSVSGAGKIFAFPLQSASVSIAISGAGSGQVNATENLTATISGAGSIRYKGHPTVSKEVSGAGSIKEDN